MIVKRHKQIKTAALYDLFSETWSMPDCPPTLMIAARNKNGDYIGNEADAEYLCDCKGIAPQLLTPESGTCTVGYSAKDNKWHGWSHRAGHGFAIGSTCKRGDCHYLPRDDEDAARQAVEFWSEPGHLNVRSGEVVEEEGVKFVQITWDCKNDDGTIEKCGAKAYLPTSYGRGEWTAKTMEDAREMAFDFAESVS